MLQNKSGTKTRQLSDNLKITSGQFFNKSWTALSHIKANSRPTPEQLKDNLGDCRTTSWTHQGHLLGIPRTTLEQP